MDNSRIAPLSAPTPAPLSVADLVELTDCFPIGNRVDYFPEYQPQMTMQSIILGYEINGHLVYRQNQLESLTTQQRGQITLHSEEKQHTYSTVNSFCLIVPAKAGEEGKLNYPSKAALGSLGQFRNGNAISLTARYKNSGVVTVECNVRESHQPSEGVYRGHRLAMLEVVATSLEMKEQRTHHRLLTNVPVIIDALPALGGQEAFLVDFSELSVQIEVTPESPLLATAEAGVHINFSLKLEHPQRTFVIGGQIIRKSGTHIIVTMQEILEQEEFRPFELMDALDVKACLLQHPATR